MKTPTQADSIKLRDVLSERGLPLKMDARLNFVDVKIHKVLCASYDFGRGYSPVEVPNHVFTKCSDELNKIWTLWLHPTPSQSGEKISVMFTLTEPAVKTVIRTAMVKDPGIFYSKINLVTLHPSWSVHLLPHRD